MCEDAFPLVSFQRMTFNFQWYSFFSRIDGYSMQYSQESPSQLHSNYNFLGFCCHLNIKYPQYSHTLKHWIPRCCWVLFWNIVEPFGALEHHHGSEHVVAQSFSSRVFIALAIIIAQQFLQPLNLDLH